MHHLKNSGYFISTMSVFLLAAVPWSKAEKEPLLMTLLIAGVSTSLMGMACRWLSYEIEEPLKGT